MAAHDNLNGDQLRMFMTPREILGEYTANFADRFAEGEQRSVHETFAHKYLEAESTGLADSIREHGVQHPIGLGELRDTVASPRIGRDLPASATVTGKKMLTGGHHRLAVAAMEAPDELVPVLHWANILEHQKSTAWGEYR